MERIDGTLLLGNLLACLLQALRHLGDGLLRLSSRGPVLKLSRLAVQIFISESILLRNIVFPYLQAPCLFQLRPITNHPDDRQDAFKDYYPRWKEEVKVTGVLHPANCATTNG
jgi:hypothetical protein